MDLLTPAAYVVDTLYLACIFLVFQQHTKTIIAFAAIVCALIIISLLVSGPIKSISLSTWLNRSISVLSILMTSMIAVYYHRINEKMLLRDKEHLLAIEQMLFMTSHKMRKPVANIIGLTKFFDTDPYQITPQDVVDHCGYLQDSALELDQVVQELNQFLRENK